MPDRPVLFITRMLPGYRIPALEHLNRRLGGRLHVYHGAPPAASSISSMTARQENAFHTIEARNYWLLGERLHAQPFAGVLNRVRPGALLIEESPRSLTLPLLLGYSRFKGIPRALWGHFSSNDRPFSPRNMGDRYRLWLARQADACVGYTDGVADLLRPYVPSGRLFVARNTLDMDVLFALHDRLAQEGKQTVRRRLGLPESSPLIVFIGRLIPEKAPGLLLDAFREIRRVVAARLLIIGDGPESQAMEAQVAQDGMEEVHFLGAMPRWEDSAPYLYASDVMLMPRGLGLSANHAFAFGLPVVSQQAPDLGIRFHGPEVEYVRSGWNGMLAEHGNVGALAEAVLHVLSEQDFFSRNALAEAREGLTLDRMVDGLEAAVRFLERQA